MAGTVPATAEVTTLDVVTLGETMALLASTEPGSLAHAATTSVGIGGSESNTAIGLARLGVRVTWVGRVGADSFGDRVLREVRGEGVDVVGVRDPGAPTGLMVKEQRTARETNVWYYRAGSAGSRLCVEDVPVDLVRAARILHVTGITPALSEGAAAAVRHAVAVAQEARTLVSFDVNYRSRLWSPADAARTLRPIVEAADVVFAGADEARLFFPDVVEPAALAAALAGLGPSQVVVKLGGDGSVAHVDGVARVQPAVPVAVVDTVGAGDAFVAGYLAELLAGADVAGRLRAGAFAGARACTVRSDWQGLPARSELERSLGAAEPADVVR